MIQNVKGMPYILVLLLSMVMDANHVFAQPLDPTTRMLVNARSLYEEKMDAIRRSVYARFDSMAQSPGTPGNPRQTDPGALEALRAQFADQGIIPTETQFDLIRNRYGEAADDLRNAYQRAGARYSSSSMTDKAKFVDDLLEAFESENDLVPWRSLAATSSDTATESDAIRVAAYELSRFSNYYIDIKVLASSDTSTVTAVLPLPDGTWGMLPLQTDGERTHVGRFAVRSGSTVSDLQSAEYRKPDPYHNGSDRMLLVLCSDSGAIVSHMKVKYIAEGRPATVIERSRPVQPDSRPRAVDQGQSKEDLSGTWDATIWMSGGGPNRSSASAVIESYSAKSLVIKITHDNNQFVRYTFDRNGSTIMLKSGRTSRNETISLRKHIAGTVSEHQIVWKAAVHVSGAGGGSGREQTRHVTLTSRKSK